MMERTDWPTIPAKYFTTVDGCSCLDWRYRGSRPGRFHGRSCKHMTALRQALELIRAINTKWQTAER